VNGWVRPLFSIIPAAWRFLQCLRRARDSRDKAQLINAGKYSTTFLVALFSSLRANIKSIPAFEYIWIICIITSTCYTSYWDVFRDWGLGDKNYNYLRKNRLYPNKMYYFAIVSNLILRLLWTLTISPDSIGIVTNANLFATILAGCEIFRRAQWNLYRVENEQLNNVGKFRAINVAVPLTDLYYFDFVAKSR